MWDVCTLWHASVKFKGQNPKLFHIISSPRGRVIINMTRLLNVTISFTEIRHSPIYITGPLLWSYWTQYLYIVTIANVCASFIPAGFKLVCPPNQLLNLPSNKLHFHRKCALLLAIWNAKQSQNTPIMFDRNEDGTNLSFAKLKISCK